MKVGIVGAAGYAGGELLRLLLGHPEVGEIVSCPDCGAELEVKETRPLALALAPAAEEDWGE